MYILIKFFIFLEEFSGFGIFFSVKPDALEWFLSQDLSIPLKGVQVRHDV